MQKSMHYCSKCGHPVEERVPEGDDRHRHVCTNCGHIHYQNPRVVVGTLPIHGDRILLCKRAIKPRAGYWTLPAGFLENGESTQEAAMRETHEEACAHIEVHDLYSMFNVIHIDQVHIFFRASLQAPEFAPGVESLEVGLFRKDEVPWKDIAFPAVSATLQQYFKDLERGHFEVRLADVLLDADNKRLIRPHNFIHHDHHDD